MTEMRQTERDDIRHIVAQHRYGTYKEMKFNISELITNSKWWIVVIEIKVIMSHQLFN